MVDWGHLGRRRFTEPFFEQTSMQCIQHPADLLFRHQTPIQFLGELAATQPGLPPTGFIFHMSRCGSTLVSQMLAALPPNIVISEAPPVDSILRAPVGNDDLRLDWLRWLFGVLGRKRHLDEKHFFVKFDSWHTLFIPLIQKAFPGVPWIFIYREPVEVLMSHLNHSGGQMIPGVLDPGLFGLDASTLANMEMHEYGARVLARICEAALAEASAGKAMLVNYRQLPAGVWPALMKHWKVNFSAEETTRMFEASKMNAKNPVLPFEDDTRAKNEGVPEKIRGLAQKWLANIYNRLEKERIAGEAR